MSLPLRESSGNPHVAGAGAFALVALFGCLCLATPGDKADPAPASASSAPAPTSPFADGPGAAEDDLVYLAQGSPVSGHILGESFGLWTAYGPIRLPAGALARIESAPAPAGMLILLTSNSNCLSGFPDQRELVIQTNPTNQVHVRIEKVSRALFRRGRNAESFLPRHEVVRLKSGDILSGKLLGAPFRIAAATGDFDLNLPDMSSIKFVSSSEPLARISMGAGHSIEGRWPGEDLELELDLGPTVRLYFKQIAEVVGQGAPPVARSEVLASQISPPLPVASIEDNQPPGTSPDDMVWIPPGRFVMGSPQEEAGRDLDEGPQTKVTFSRGLWMGRHEVTQGQYRALMGVNPSDRTDDPQRPVDKVTWREAMDYCERLTEQQAKAGALPAGFSYRLPTEAEWEYACRAGSTTRFSFGDDSDTRRLGDFAWFSDNSESMSHPVGLKKPNPWGLYDMHGNVLEWCLDAAASSLPGGNLTNYQALAEGSLRIARGGSWLYGAKASRSANRDNYGVTTRCSDVGFRVVLAPSAP